MTSQAVIWGLAGLALAVAGASVAPYLSAEPAGTALVVSSPGAAFIQPAAFRSDCDGTGPDFVSRFAVTTGSLGDGRLVVSLRPLVPGLPSAFVIGVDTSGKIALVPSVRAECKAGPTHPPEI